jgi:hypothetical protein
MSNSQQSLSSLHFHIPNAPIAESKYAKKPLFPSHTYHCSIDRELPEKPVGFRRREGPMRWSVKTASDVPPRYGKTATPVPCASSDVKSSSGGKILDANEADVHLGGGVSFHDAETVTVGPTGSEYPFQLPFYLKVNDFDGSVLVTKNDKTQCTIKEDGSVVEQ